MDTFIKSEMSTNLNIYIYFLTNTVFSKLLRIIIKYIYIKLMNCVSVLIHEICASR